MNNLLRFNPEPFETEAELNSSSQYYDSEHIDPEWEAELEVRRSRNRTRPGRSGVIFAQRTGGKSIRSKSPRAVNFIKPGSVNLSKFPSKLPFLPIKPQYFRPPYYPVIPPIWPMFPFPGRIPEKNEPAEPRTSDRSGSEPGSGTPPEQMPTEQPSEHVRWVQSCLNQVMGLRLTIDGILNVETRSAVRSFQERQGLRKDGLVGPETEQALKDACKSEGSPVSVEKLADSNAASDAQPASDSEWEYGSSTSQGSTSTFDSQAFRRQIVQIANRELERWGNGKKKELTPGMWKVLQDYWATGTGNRFTESQLRDPTFQNANPWSAAFISWVMKKAGAGDRFKYSSMHSVYTRWAKDNRTGNKTHPFKAYRVTELAPQVGDLVCKRRANSGASFDTIRPGMQTHCDIVTGVERGRITTVGGNVSNSVKQTFVKTDAKGFLVDPNYFTVIRISDAVAPSVAPPAPQRTVAAPKLLKQETTPPGTTLYADIDLGIVDKFGIPAAPMTGIFIPQGFVPNKKVDVILYLHGFKPEKNRKLTINQYWNSQHIPYAAFREGLNASDRNVILVAPTLGAHSEAGSLIKPGGLDAYLVQVMECLRAYGPHSRFGKTPGLGNLILACHSAGGWPMRQLAGSRRGLALAHLRECWGFDCTYNRGDDTFWAEWGRVVPNAKVYIYYIPGSQTAPLAERLRNQRVTNVIVQPSKERRHNHVPIAYWQERIAGAPFLTARAGAAGSRFTTINRETGTVPSALPWMGWRAEAAAGQPFNNKAQTSQCPCGLWS